MKNARTVVVEALVPAASYFPDISPIVMDTPGFLALLPQDRALATAILRQCLERWLTLEHLLNHFLKQPFDQLEPPMKAVLLSGSAQLLFFDRLPDHAVVNESVEIAKRLIRPGAGGLVNAVLRKLKAIAGDKVLGSYDVLDPKHASSRLPLAQGYIQLDAPYLPGIADISTFLSIATSHRKMLVMGWIKEFGQAQTIQICLHNLLIAPIWVATETGYQKWSGSGSELTVFLAGHPDRRVQDPTSAEPVAGTGALKEVKLIIDYCAGLGTKTKQLTQLHPHAKVYAADTDATRYKQLQATFAAHPQVTVCPYQALPGGADLLVLDVPCTNTGVLARRPEARYRFSDKSLASVIQLQNKIIEQSLGLVGPSGSVLYSTCSIDPTENQLQKQVIKKALGGEVLCESLTLPSKPDEAYHDGGYYTLVGR